VSVDIGIIGLAKSGRTTIFNALTRGKADTGDLAPHIGIAKVPEPRLKVLVDMLHPKRVVPAEVRYVDIDASVKGLAKDKAIGGLELAFSDLVIIERRLERIELSLKGAKQLERQGLLQEQEMLTRVKAELENEMPIRELGLTTDEARTIANYQFLTAKPLLIVVNIGEDQLPQAASLEAELNSHYSRPKCSTITLCGKLEMELTQLDNSAAEGFRTEFGISESGPGRIIKLSYQLLGLISFFTTASGEVKAWSIQNGTGALKAAGKIHSDMERGFIRAEVTSYDDLVRCGSLSEARKRGVLRLEGKNYIVQDGDVITFLFNV